MAKPLTHGQGSKHWDDCCLLVGVEASPCEGAVRHSSPRPPETRPAHVGPALGSIFEQTVNVRGGETQVKSECVSGGSSGILLW